MITLSEKFLKEARRAGCKPAAIVGFVKDALSAEADFKSHWDAALSSSNIDTAEVPGEVHIAKTLATTGVSQLLADNQRQLIEQVRRNSRFVWRDNVFVFFQSFKVSNRGFLDKIKIAFGKIPSGTGTASTGYIGITDSNERMLESVPEPQPFSSSEVINPKTWIERTFSDKNVFLEAATEYKIYTTQTPQSQTIPLVDVLMPFVGTGNPYAEPLRRGVNAAPSTEALDVDLTFEVTMLPRYQTTGSISIKLDLGTTPLDPGEWEFSDIRDGETTIVYQAWASATGAFAGEETSLGTIADGDLITNLKRYYKITATLSASADNLVTPKILKLKANFDVWERYCLADKPISWKGDPLPPIVMALPQIQYQMDPLEGKASISRLSVDFLDEGFLEQIITTYFLKNNEIRIFVGFDAPGWDAEDYAEFWRGEIVDWERRTGVITLVCADWAIDTKVEIPEEYNNPLDPNDPKNGTIEPIVFDGHPSDLKEDLLSNKVNMRDSKIHFQSFADNKVALPGWRLFRTVPKPTDAWKLIQEINRLEGSVLIPREDGKLFDYLFDPATDHVAEFGPDQVQLNSTTFKARMDLTLINQAIVYFGFRVPFALTGTVTVTQNSKTVTGSGTQFIDQLAVGMEVQGPDSRIYVVESIASDTSLGLETVYSGSTQSGQTLTRPRTDEEGKPSSYQGAAVHVDADSVLNYKETSTERILPSPWLGPNDGTYQGDVRAAEIAERIVDWGKDGLALVQLTTSLEFIGLQVGDFIRLGSLTTLPRNLVGFTWTRWVLTSKTIDFKRGAIGWSMMKVPSGTAYFAQLRAYSEWLAAATGVLNLVISQWPTEVILDFTDTEKTDKLDTEAEWNAYELATNLLIEA